MTDELLRWSGDGALAYIHPLLVEEIGKRLVDEQGASVWQRLDACDRALLHLTAQLTELQNELSVVSSIQRVLSSLEERLLKVESSDETVLQQFSASLVDLRRRVHALETPKTSEIGVPLITAAVPFKSLVELVETVEKMFDCKDGDSRAWHSTWDENRSTYDMHPYVVIGCIAPALMPNAQEFLRYILYTAFHKLRQTCKTERPVLFWRYAAPERILEEDSLDNSVNPNPRRYKIRTRVAIPEADFSVINKLVKEDDASYVVLKE